MSNIEETSAPAQERIEITKIRERYPEAILSIDEFRGDTRILIQREAILDVCRLLKTDPDLQYNFLSECLGVDYLDARDGYRFEVVYNLYSLPYDQNGIRHGKNHRIFLKVPVPEEDAVVPSVFEVYPACELPEREIYDMFGVRFAGHPDLRRLLMPDDWVEIGRAHV